MRSSYPTVAPHLRSTACTDSLTDCKGLRRVSITRQAREGYDCTIGELDDYMMENERDALFDGDEVIGMCYGWNQE